MSDLDIYGNIVSFREVRLAVQAVLEERLVEYIARQERKEKREVGSVGVPGDDEGSFIHRNDLDHWPEEMLPSIVTVVPDLEGPPQKDGEGNYRARFRVGIGAVVGADTKSNANALAELFGAAIRECLLQNQSLEGFSEAVDWENERYDELNDEKQNLAAASVIFIVEVRGVVNKDGGLPDPPEDPYEEPEGWDQVEKADEITVTQMEDES